MHELVVAAFDSFDSVDIDFPEAPLYHCKVEHPDAPDVVFKYDKDPATDEESFRILKEYGVLWRIRKFASGNYVATKLRREGTIKTRRDALALALIRRAVQACYFSYARPDERADIAYV